MIAQRVEGEQFAELASALRKAGLRSHDLEEPGHSFYRVADEPEAFGYAGLEAHGPDALLRSVVSPVKGRGNGRRVVEATLNEAKRLGIERVWLLTETAEGFFERLGFARADRATAPAPIAATEQFSSLCPASAVFMKREI